MAQQKLPNPPSLRTTEYSNLLGVDYQMNETEINRRRSPDMVNMISDLGGSPIKRCGYRKLGVKYDKILEHNDLIYGFAVRTYQSQGSSSQRVLLEIDRLMLNGTGYTEVDSITASDMMQHGEEFKDAYYIGNRLFVRRKYGTHRIIYGDEPSHETIGICLGTGYYVGDFDSDEQLYKAYLYEPIPEAIPTVSTLLKPNGAEMVTLPAGSDITGATQGVNALTPARRVEYCVQTDTADETSFVIPDCKYAYIFKVEVLSKGTYDWITLSDSDISSSSWGKSYSKAISCDKQLTCEFAHWQSTVVLAQAPYIKVVVNNEPHLRFRAGDNDIEVPAGVPNVRITYAPFDNGIYSGSGADATANGYYRKKAVDLYNSSASIVYDSRLFLAIDNRVYYSDANNPFMIQDDHYFEVDSNVKGFVRTSTGLGIIGSGSQPIYLASGGYDESQGMAVYRIKATNANIRLKSAKCTATLNDEPIMITEDGIYGLLTNYFSEKYAVLRSGKVNRKLLAEPRSDLKNAVAVAYKNYLYISVGTHMYVLDGRHRDMSRNGDNSYEAFYFEDMPNIKAMYVAGGHMFFDDNNETYTWNDDLFASHKAYIYYDGGQWDSGARHPVGGTAVKAKWTSPLDGDGAPHYYKVLNKKGVMVTLAPPRQTSCEITIVKDANERFYIGEFNEDTFALSDSVLDAFTKKKIKKYKRLQFIIENNKAEPFGLISVIKTYTIGNFAKR